MDFVKSIFDFDFPIEIRNTVNIPFKFEPLEKTTNDEVVTTYTSTVQLADQKPLTAEQEADISKWFSERMQRDLERQMFGYPTEFQLSLRAAGAKV
jgi:hypothetical protein